ncbi:MAG: uracil-DNA glycosylase [Candidatus Pacebacteria bacterium]|nr:uracil-DNA glycosylase [Parcubacteria group bacterium]MDP7466083.1 uracil-DNA glycosylase [Candidatus Paceibacterota bacterium]HJO89707.1 uracil-DNA glycosylase [Candidatus Paceibacterota bacterium]|tara:strand:- start:7557 stop:8135 length:579 start_codon:yes stop_codon:yes gene_type:complete
MTKTEQMKKIRDEVFELKNSPLYQYRTENGFFPVIGEGNHDADIMFIGEAPGRNEAKTGRPFCGAAGKILDDLLASIKVPRENVYITNIVKDRPQNNRDPLPEEIEIYGPFLDRQIKIIEPKVIATLGRYSMEYIMKKFGLERELKTISLMHGKSFDSGGLKIVPLYHPAATIYNRDLIKTLEEGFKILKNI